MIKNEFFDYWSYPPLYSNLTCVTKVAPFLSELKIMGSIIEKLKICCESNKINYVDKKGETILIRLPDMVGPWVAPKIMAEIEYFHINESLRITCSLGKAYGSKLNQALRLNNILDQSRLSVVRKNGEDHFNLIFWNKVSSEFEEDYDLSNILDMIALEIDKIKPLLLTNYS